MVATFEQHPDPAKRETKNCFRYVETDDSPSGGGIGSLYVQKIAVKMLLGGTAPAKLTVTVEAAS
jgi:hypothetical protein